jgi:two-component system phosphate regulon sensor histidine kinase PhoR
MSRLRWLAGLMGMVIIIITGFQVYWLKDNYQREKKAVEVRTGALFHETVRQVQDSLLQQKIFIVMKDSSIHTTSLKRKILPFPFKTRADGQPNPARLLNVITKTVLDDSLMNMNKEKKGVFISVKSTAQHQRSDSAGNIQFVFDSLSPEDMNEVVVVNSKGEVPSNKERPGSLKVGKSLRTNEILNVSKTADKDSNNNRVSQINTIYFNTDRGESFSIKIDSLLNDSIPTPLLAAEFARRLKSEKLDIPFAIQRDTIGISNEGDFIRRPMMAGFPGYKVQLGNTFPYLIKQITLPILFSIFLVGITIFSLVLLYRSLFKQYRLGQIKNDLISNITHELKTPIATVGVAIEALRNFGATQSPEKTKEYLDISASELQRLGLLVDKVLKISMLENKRIELKKESFNMRELVQEVLNIMKLQFEKHHAQVNVNTTGDNFVIEADRLHITSVIYNLLDNALKYSRENPVINVQLSSLPNDILELKISDNGIGISKEFQAKIFDKFFRVPTGNTHNIKGYGLGLSYVREILSAHMGFISVESEPGKGSSFSVKLPFKEAPVIYFDDKRRIYKKVIKL